MKHRTISKNQRGATAVEFAIILPLLLLVVFGIIEISLLLFNKHVITHACREGARAGIVARGDRFRYGASGFGVDEVDVRSVVTDWLGGHLITFGANTFDPDDDIDVEIVDRSLLDPTETCETATPNPLAPDTDAFFDWERIEDLEGDPDDGPCTSFQHRLQVTVRYDYDFLVLSIFLDPITLESRSLMLME
jgi:hypothetical protein